MSDIGKFFTSVPKKRLPEAPEQSEAHPDKYAKRTKHGNVVHSHASDTGSASSSSCTEVESNAIIKSHFSATGRPECEDVLYIVSTSRTSACNFLSETSMDESQSTQQSKFCSDIGWYVKSSSLISDDDKHKLLTDDTEYELMEQYIKNDVEGETIKGKKRSFRLEWLKSYKPWLSNSKLMKGPMCKMCVLFHPPVHRGIQGAFITTPCKRYHDFN